MGLSFSSVMQYLLRLGRRGVVAGLRGLAWLLLAMAWVWSCLAIWLFRPWPPDVTVPLTLLWVLLTVGLFVKLPRAKAARCLAASIVWIWAAWSLQSARNDRTWGADQARLPRVTIADERIVIDNVRCASYRSENDYDVRWERRAFDLDQLESVDFVMVPFPTTRALAHVFVTFGFRDGEHLCVSIEVRKTQGEKYSPLYGMFRRYELIYVLGDESDLIGLRANARRLDVYLYPVKARQEQVRALFLSMLARAERLRTAPEFYNTATNSCSSNLLWHVNQVRQEPVWWSWRVLLPGFSDELALELGLIDFEGSLDEARTRFSIQGRTVPWTTGKTWSRQIRTPREPSAAR
ncbi:MAG: Lnb N-terminal periplasmic domain-containing protein [Pirellulales bacterium]